METHGRPGEPKKNRSHARRQTNGEGGPGTATTAAKQITRPAEITATRPTAQLQPAQILTGVNTSPGAIRSDFSQRSGENVTPFTSIDRCRAFYRAAFDFHERHSLFYSDRINLQRNNKEIFESPDMAVNYWMTVSNDMTRTAAKYGNDPFMIDLLCDVYSELERNFKAARAAVSA